MARKSIPTGALAYPLVGIGERFPFLSTTAEGFADEHLSGERLFGASLEGVAYSERMGFELIEHLSGSPVKQVSTAGGGSNSNTWLQVRADVLAKPITRMKCPQAATGAAIVAASGTRFRNLEEAAKAMAVPDSVVEPGELQDHYDEEYRRFQQELVARGIIDQVMNS